MRRNRRYPGQKFSSYGRRRKLGGFRTQHDFGAIFDLHSFAEEQMPVEFKVRLRQLKDNFWAIKKDGPIAKKLLREFHRFHDDLEPIIDARIKELFEATREVKFSARRFNHFEYRYVGIENGKWWIPLRIFFPAIGVQVGELRRVFTRGYKTKADNPYDRLGWFPLNDQYFVTLAKLLDKPVKVLREDGGSGEHYHIFTANPDGSIIEAETKAA